jgi:hypothetical protein
MHPSMQMLEHDGLLFEKKHIIFGATGKRQFFAISHYFFYITKKYETLQKKTCLRSKSDFINRGCKSA